MLRPLACALLLLGACGGSDGLLPIGTGGGAGEGGSQGGSDGGSLPVEEDPFDPPPPAEPLPDEAIAALGQQIDAIVAPFAAQSHSILLVGADTGQVIYERDPDRLLKPASNTKLFTSAAALALLGEEHRIHTAVYATSAPAGGVVDGDLVLVGRHDFTWSTQLYDDPRFPLDRLAASLAQLGITQVNGTVQVRGEVLYDGYQFAYYDASTHRATAAARFVSALSDAGIAVGGGSVSAEMDPPSGAVELGRWRSVPLAVGCSPLNVISHNEFADVLSRHLGWERSQSSSYDGGEAAMLELLAAAPEPLDLNGVAFYDGSGLSHDNRVAARHVVGLFELMAERPEGLAFERSLAIAGVRGTLANRMQGADTAGRFFGKTGTLSDTIALSGVLYHRHDGQRYLASMLMNGVTNQSAARGAHNAIVEALAADLRGQGARPDAPELLWVKSDANGQSVSAAWQGVPEADGYLVWRSADGKRWPREQARWVHRTEHRTLPIEGAETLYLRISAWSAAGPSAPSDVYAAGFSSEPSEVLVVDGNDRWELEPAPENTLAEGHDFAAVYAQSLTGLGHDTCSNEAVLAGGCPLEDYPVVIWSLGEESTADLALDADEQDALAAYTAMGGSLFISGAELAYQLAGSGDPDDLAFLGDVLKAGLAGDDAGTYVAAPTDPLLEAGELLGFLTPDRMIVRYPDQLTPQGSEPFASYVGGLGGVAGLRYQGSYRLVYLGFPFESIDGLDDRNRVLDAVLDVLSP